jgi:hypothetical protein
VDEKGSLYFFVEPGSWIHLYVISPDGTSPCWVHSLPSKINSRTYTPANYNFDTVYVAGDDGEYFVASATDGTSKEYYFENRRHISPPS